MTINQKFYAGEMVYNPSTNETGTIKRSYEENGVRKYEVALLVPFRGLTSDWEENCLEHSPKGQQKVSL
jgi:hypothetical protein